MNLAFICAYLVCSYNFYRAITLDPGYSKLPKDDAELHSVRCRDIPLFVPLLIDLPAH